MADPIRNENSGTLVSGTASKDTILNDNYDATNVTINAGRGNDFIDSQTDNSYIDGGDGNDTIYNYYHTRSYTFRGPDNVGGEHVTINGGAGSDSIKNVGNYGSINGGADDDIIINDAKHTTINGGAGNDTIDLTQTDGNVIEYGAGGGDDVLINYREKKNDRETGMVQDGDIISLIDGVSMTGGYIADNETDLVLQIGDGTLTIKKGVGKTIRLLDSTVEDPEDPDNAIELDGPVIVNNSAAGAEIVTGSFNDKIVNSGANVLIQAGAGSDYIKNTGRNVTIDGESGDDVIENYGANVSVVGSGGNDIISNYGADSTIRSGTGDDTLKVGVAGIIEIGANDGNDVLVDYDSNTKIYLVDDAVVGGYSVDGMDIILKIGKGTLRIKEGFNKPIAFIDIDDNVTTKTYGTFSISNEADYRSVAGTDKADRIYNNGVGATVNGGKGADTIKNEGARSMILGGAGNDKIIDVSEGYATLNGGTGNDTIELANDANHVIVYGAGQGNDVVVGYGSSDSLQLSSGSIKGSAISGNDITFTVASGSTSSTIKLQNAATRKITFIDSTGKVLASKYYGPAAIDNSAADTLITGTDYGDTITNYASGVTIKGAKGDDQINNEGEGARLIGGDGNDRIINKASKTTIESEAGNDVITNIGNFAKINSGAGDDYIVNSGRKVTIQAGAGNDTIESSGIFGDLFLFNASDGNDVIMNFGAGDTIKIGTGTIVGYNFVNNDEHSSLGTVTVTVKSGSTKGTIKLIDVDNNFTASDDGKYFYYDGKSSSYETIDNEQSGTEFIAYNDDDDSSDYYITNKSEDVTIRTGLGDDTIEDSELFGNVFDFAPGDGRDVILNFGVDDTLHAGAGSILATMLAGNDLLVTIANDEDDYDPSLVTLLGAASYPIKIDNGEFLTVVAPKTIRNNKSNTNVSGTDDPDVINNSGSNVTINPGGGNDTISLANYPELILFGATDGQDTIKNWGKGDSIKITSGTIQSRTRSGNDYVIIVKQGSYIGTLTLKDAFKGNPYRSFKVDGSVLTSDDVNYMYNNKPTIVSGTTYDDYITNNAAATIKGSKGNDTVIGSDYDEVFTFAYNNGANVIYNFDDGDMLRVTDGKISSFKKYGSDDYLVTVTKSNSTVKSTILLKDTAAFNTDEKKIVQVNNVVSIDAIHYFDADKANSTVNGTSGRDVITNTFQNVVIDPGAGNDTITGSDSYADLIKVKATYNDNIVTNFGKDDSIQSTNGTLTATKSGSDYILTITKNSSTSKVTLQGAAAISSLSAKSSGNTFWLEQAIETIYGYVGTAKSEWIINEQEGVTVDGGKGDDTIVGSDGAETFKVSYALGNDVIENFDKTDTLRSTGGTIAAIDTIGNDVLVDIQSGMKKSTITLKGTKGYKFITSSNKKVLTVEPDIQTIESTRDDSTLTGTARGDILINYHSNVTIRGQGGNDTIYGNEDGDERYLFAYNLGNDIVYNFGENDTFQSTGGTIAGIDTVNSDVLVTLRNGTKGSSVITLKDAKGYEFIKKSSKILTVDHINTIDNTEDGKQIVGKDFRDSIVNSAADVTIKPNAGDDTIEGSDFYGEVFVFDGFGDNNVITNFGINDTLYVSSGTLQPIDKDGDDAIVEIKQKNASGTLVTLQGAGAYKFVKSGKTVTVEQPANIKTFSKDKKSFNGTNANDYMINSGERVTIDGKGGRDTIVGSDGGDVFKFSAIYLGNVITNFDDNDTLYITSGTIQSRHSDGKDYIINVKNENVTGVVTLQGAANYEYVQTGSNILTVNKVNYITSNDDDTIVAGSDKADRIYTSGENVTISSGKGNDTITGSNFGDVFAFAYNTGKNVITNFDADDTLRATSGKITAVKKSGKDQIVTIANSTGNTTSTVTLKDMSGYTFDTTTTTLKVAKINEISKTSKTVKGTNGRDLIMSTGKNATITANAGNDTITGSDTYGDVFSFSYTHNDNVIKNFGKDDSIYASNGTITYEAVDDDVLVSISKNNTVATVLLEDVVSKGYIFKKTGKYLIVDNNINYIINDRDNTVISGKSGKDHIINNGQSVTIKSGAGNDTLEGSDFAEVYYFAPNSGKNVVTDFGANDTLRISDGTFSTKKSGANVLVTIKGAASSSYVTLQGASALTLQKNSKTLYAKGINVISNSKDKVKLGTSKDDYITNHGSKVTITAGAGNDTIVSSDEAETFTFAYTHGNDVIENFGTNDTLRITDGTISANYKSGDDYVIEVTKKNKSAVGKITFKDAGNSSFTVSTNTLRMRNSSTGSNAELAPSIEDYWFTEAEQSIDQSINDPLDEIVQPVAAVDYSCDLLAELKQSELDQLAYSARHQQKK